jgi:hypothetical protein
MPVIDWNVEQGTPRWYSLRAGIPTASEFDKVMTPKKMEMASARHAYACRIIAGRLLNWQADSLDKIQHIADGKAGEPIAIARLEMVYLDGAKTRRVGFIRTNDRRLGASPDRVAGVSADETHVNTVIEAKSPTIPKQFEYLLFGHDEAYRCQVQGQLYVAEADKAIFQSSNPRMPDYTVETGRDEPFIKKLADALERFSDELEAWTEKAIAAGSYQKFAEIATPLDAERGDGVRRDPLMTEAELADLIERDMLPSEHHRAEA